MLAFIRFVLWAILILITIPVCLFIKRFIPKLRFSAPRLHHKILCKIIGIQVEVKGDISQISPTLFVSNHLSYLDIPLLGSLIKGSFVSKKEVRSWPVIGFLSTLQNTVYVKRERKNAGAHSNILVDRVQEGDSLIVFPEGTSGYGNKVLPFKSSLFSIASQKVKYEGKDNFLKIQPVSICFAKLNGEIVSYSDRQYYSWVGDEELFPHLPRFFGFGKKKMIVEFHPVISMDQFENRKDIARYCQEVIAEGVSNKISGK